jgi:hypothetical protein
MNAGIGDLKNRMEYTGGKGKLRIKAQGIKKGYMIFRYHIAFWSKKKG